MGVAFAVETQYVYDELGRLVQAARSDGTVIQYVYDANGNLLSINRHGASSLAIATFSPTITHATATVLISGSGFSAVPSENAVVVGGAPAVVSAATATQLTITVPMTAQSGLISVTTGGNTATSTQQIVVRRPSISSFSPKLVNPGATVSISGNQLNLMPGTTVFSASGVPLALNSLTNTSASLTIPANASGRIRVQTAYGEAFSVDNLYVLPASRPVTTVVASATVGVGGAAADISVNQPGKLAVLAFDATAGQRLTVQFDVFSTTPSGYTASYSIYSPTGSSMFTETGSAARKSIH
jgi:YD repeat-containing protein